jgi:molybdopterin synthase catalytic subunit
MQVEITDAVIPAAAIVAEIKAGPDGAVCVFDGIVRDNSRGRKTLYLDYEAYREMALEQMRGLAAEAATKFGVRDVALVHRLGRLQVGETSVLVVVASAHRGAAFDACRWLIDTLKKTVPIWKKEQFVDGAVWADGEAFPSEIGLPKASEAKAQWADGEAFPEAVALGQVPAPGEESGRPSDDAHISESRYGAPDFVARERSEEGVDGRREENGRPSDDAHVPNARDGAPGFVGRERSEEGVDGRGEENGRPSDDAHVPNAGDGAPGFVGRGRPGAGR